MLIADISDLGPLDTAERRAFAAQKVQRELTAAVARMWALYEAPDGCAEIMNREQPPEAEQAYAGSLDEWWYACKEAESAWGEAAKAAQRAAADAWLARNPSRQTHD